VSQQCAALAEPGPSMPLLIYPATDLSAETASYDTYGDGFYLTRTRMDWFKDLYIPIDERKDVRASPLLNRTLEGQPPTQMVTAGFDPLRDEGRAYAEALEASGVRVTYDNYEGVIHGFANMASLIPAARRAYENMVGTLRTLLRD